MTVRKLKGSAIQSGTITTTQLSSSVNESISAGGGPKVSSLTYPGDDTAANTVGGQTIRINGTGFASNSTVYVNGNAVASVTYNSSSNLIFTTPALSAATYPLYVINPEDGATAIFVPGLQISGEPTWVTGATLSEQDVDTAWNISLSATSDSNVSYTLAGGSSLPSGISLAANGLISGTLSSPPNDETTYNFTVVAADEENQDASRAFSVNVTTGEGVAFANTVLLLHGDGTNNQNNHTFLDSSDNNFTITRNGNAIQGSFSPFSQTGWSGYFDGTGDYLTTANSSVNNFGSSDWTIEFWINSTKTTRGDPFGWNYSFNNAGWGGMVFNLSASGDMSWFEQTTSRISASSTGWNNGAWNHVAVTRSGNSVRMFLNGTQKGSTYTTSFSYGANPSGFIIGAIPSGTEMSGYISNFRILKGTALYTENFTPPTAPLTNVANTSLLTLQSNRFIDNSNNNFTITRNGDTQIVPYSPFAPTSRYTTAAVGGSGYFDGSGDYLLSPASANVEFNPSNGFTIEGWVHPQSTGTFQFIVSSVQGTGGFESWWFVGIASGGNWRVSYGGASAVDTGTAVVFNTWSHFALSSSGTNTKFFVNGIQIGNVNVNQQNTNMNLTIGNYSGTTQYMFKGYISNLRYVKGIQSYTEAFTPPTSPLTNIANTSLLCNFTNAGIFDSTAKNVLETVGDAKVSTSVVKYGTGSINIPSTSDTVKMLGVELLADFTIEGWAKPAIGGGEKFFIIQGINATNGFLIGLTTSQILWRSNGTTDISAAISKADWYHFAIVRSGSGSNNVKVYVDGSQVTQGTYTNTILPSVGALNIGPGGSINSSFASYGYIDDFRISRFARYTSNFTPPTAAFKDR